MNQYPKEELKRLISESLREKQDSYVIQELFQQFPTTTELLDVSEQQLITIKGIGSSKARQITAMLQLAKSLPVPSQTNYTIRTPKDVFDLLAPELRYLNKEHFICLFLNTKNQVICDETISIGSLNAAIVHPREVFRAAIKRCSASLICVHNHPSGDPAPLSTSAENSPKVSLENSPVLSVGFRFAGRLRAEEAGLFLFLDAIALPLDVNGT